MNGLKLYSDNIITLLCIITKTFVDNGLRLRKLCPFQSCLYPAYIDQDNLVVSMGKRAKF